MKKGFLFLMVLMLVTLTACNSGGSNANSNNEVAQSASTGFTSEQDVRNFCKGKSFSIPSLGTRSTDNDADIKVLGIYGNTAEVRIYFDFAGDKLAANFRVNKETGDYEWFR